MSLSSFDRLLVEVQNNNVNRTAIDFWELNEVGHGRRLGEALRFNATITKVALRMDGTVVTNDVLLSSSDETTTESIANELSPLLDYLQTSSTLQELLLIHMEQQTSVSTSLLLTAIANNPNRLGVRFCYNWPRNVISNFMEQAKSITRLAFDDFDTSCEDAAANQSFVEALERHTSLVKLEMDYMKTNSLEFVNSVLKQLETHPSLQHLTLDFRFFDNHPIPSGLSSLLSSTKTKLPLLEIRSDDPQQCVNILSLPTRVQSFKFKGNRFCTGTDDGCFDRLLQAKSTSATKTNLYIEQDVIKQGSSGLFRVPLHSQFRIREVVFHITLSRPQLVALAYFLPQSLFLQRLCIRWIAPYQTVVSAQIVDEAVRDYNLPVDAVHPAPGLTIGRLLVQSVCQNGSLTMLENERDTNLLPPTQHRKLSAYLDRNRELPRLVSSLGTIVESSTVALSTSALSQTNMLLAPSLFEAAQPAAQTAPTHLLSGLLAVGSDLTGPSISCKRAHLLSN